MNISANTFDKQKLPILQICGLTINFRTQLGWVQAADNVSLDIFNCETLALVGETGCGKSVVASAILQLLPNNAAVQGKVLFLGKDLLILSEKEMSRIRGSEISTVFQNPSLALNPLIRVEEQIAEPLRIHQGMSRRRSLDVAEEFLGRLGLEEKRLKKMYPFQFSGGMNQRVMIATSMILSPKIIIADEPTKGLDRSLAKDVIAEMAKIKDFTGASLLLITHDLSMARTISDRMAVMYSGEIVEMGETEDIFREPLHPYTLALLDCLPERGFKPVKGSSPSMINPPKGCKFHPRCPHKCERCMQRPAIREIMGKKNSRQVRCWLC
jgi:peptide/nickel transport system ATP-binding protein